MSSLLFVRFIKLLAEGFIYIILSYDRLENSSVWLFAIIICDVRLFT